MLTGGTNRLLELKEREEADTIVNQKIEEEVKFIKGETCYIAIAKLNKAKFFL